MSGLVVLWEDEDLIFVDKPAGLLSQQAHDPDETHLHAIVCEYLKPSGQTAFLLQRLDRGTTGVMFFPKQKDLNARLNRAFEARRISKSYLALVEGRLSIAQTIDAPIARIGPISFGVRPHGKRAVTSVLPKQSAAGASVIQLELHTGRTHQIRVHLAAIGHPLVGDWLYGHRDDRIRPMLHAHRLRMRHPRTDETLDITSPIPEDFLNEAEARGLSDDW